ncbi:MAG: DnaJ domain-containing protein [Phycisphaerales bacterium]|nr:DnaJ domain-containing protein [Phycisphaerales bacterium]
MDPFDALGLPARFELDEGTIRRAYLARVGAVHPDAAGGEGAEASNLNEARATLSDPEQRANALLDRLGGPSKEADRSLPDGFLARMMAVREEVEADLASGGAEARARWEAWAVEQRREHERRVGAMFAGLADGASADALRAIRTELNAWRYVERLIEQLDPQYDATREA